MTTQDLDSFFINGFYLGHIQSIECLNVDLYNFADCNNVYNDTATDPYRPELDTNLKAILQETNTFLIENYISKVFSNYEFIEYYAWEGVDPGSSVWHNDKIEGFNSNILVYLDDSLNSNTIEIKNNIEEFKIYHKKGDFVWLNQSTRFLHRATHKQGRRRVLSFQYKIQDLWT